MAKTKPQCALSGLNESLQAEWKFSNRVLGGSSQLFQPLDNLLMEKFLPAILRTSSSSSMERRLFRLPARKGGLGVSNPTSLTTRHGKQLRFFMMLLLISTVFPMKTTESKCFDRGKKHHRIVKEKHEELLGELLNELPADQVRAVKRINEGSLSAWLTALPIAAENFDLSEVEFRDALSVRYNKNLGVLPIFYDGCQSPFTLRHALACKKMWSLNFTAQ